MRPLSPVSHLPGEGKGGSESLAKGALILYDSGMTERLKKGTLRDDGLVFWGYDKSKPNGERWMKVSTYEKKRESARVRARTRYQEQRPNNVKSCRVFLSDAERRAARNVCNRASDARRRKDGRIKPWSELPLMTRLARNAQTRVLIGLKRKRIKKSLRTHQYIGCTWDQLRFHLENQFEEGMNWDNWSKEGWHIDHKIPICSACNQDDLIRILHFTNLQPLWAKENLSKGGR